MFPHVERFLSRFPALLNMFCHHSSSSFAAAAASSAEPSFYLHYTVVRILVAMQKRFALAQIFEKNK